MIFKRINFPTVFNFDSLNRSLTVICICWMTERIGLPFSITISSIIVFLGMRTFSRNLSSISIWTVIVLFGMRSLCIVLIITSVIITITIPSTWRILISSFVMMIWMKTNRWRISIIRIRSSIIGMGETVTVLNPWLLFKIRLKKIYDLFMCAFATLYFISLFKRNKVINKIIILWIYLRKPVPRKTWLCGSAENYLYPQ